ncbi:unnamed protein product [Schistosoma curassoni]|uniref:Uncharacterized protein n=1 Tax=Schistosoma curassoni TaxID=6186 RepID=A0A183KEJ9_9TREM|nr:unnamed protein product [Schistosoma curassoni]
MIMMLYCLIYQQNVVQLHMVYERSNRNDNTDIWLDHMKITQLLKGSGFD